MTRQIDSFPNIDNLPQMPAPFIGRDKDLAKLGELLANPACRLLTLVGPGGIGKTRLAQQVAADLREQYPDGVWLVELAPLCDPALVPQAIASALGLREEQGRPLLEVLAGTLQPRRLLLVLDNCEHLVDASANVARSLLSTCPNLRIVATSRERLHVAGEVAWPVPPLSVPNREELETAETLKGYESVQLFVDRAERAFPDFAITRRNASTIAQICSRLDGLPLAIELAAAWVKALSVSQIAERLDDRLRLLTTGDRAGPARHQTLRAALDWGYDLLDEQERTLFRRLAVFAGSFDLGAVEAVCSGDGLEMADVLDLVGHLVDKSLVMVAREVDQGRRYRLLETVRQYAVDALGRDEGVPGAAEPATLGERHLDWYLALAEQEKMELWGTADAASLQRLELEEDNFRVALRWSLANAGVEKGLRLASALTGYWYVRAHLNEGRYWLEQVLAASEGTSVPSRALALDAAGALAAAQGDQEQATAFLEEGLFLSKEQGDDQLGAWILQSFGLVHLYSGDYERAERFFLESLAIFWNTGDKAGISSVLLYRGTMACHQEQYRRAEAILQLALPLLRELGDAVGIARALHGLGVVARHRGEAEQARVFHRESLEVARERGARLEVSDAMEGLAGVASVQGRPREAARLLGAAEALRQEIGTNLSTGSRLAQIQDARALRAQLKEDGFEAACDEGRALTLEQAVEEAMAVADEPVPPKVTATAGASLGPRTKLQEAKLRYDGLTKREREVATLIAQGRSNAAIAEDLFVTVRTVEAHVTHILQKLGFSSRTQIAIWAVDRGLASAPKTLDEKMRE